MSGKRDFQRRRVYAWEDRAVAPRDPSSISFSEAQAMINAIWSEMGLLYPPKAEPLALHATATIASANRLTLFLAERTPSWCLLHELAHAMTSTMDGQSDEHGSLFMGIYVKLLCRYLRLDQIELVRALQDEGIAVDVDAKPIFTS